MAAGQYAKKIRPIQECEGCARNKRTRCDVLEDCKYFWKKYGYCFAKVDEARAAEIERELTAITGRVKGVRC